MIKLDYKITSPEERNDLVNQIIEDIGFENLNEKALEILTDYLIFCMEKEEKKQKNVLTDNRMTTVNKRETSLEGLTDKLENGEDGLYNLIANDKNIIFSPAISITPEDLAEIPPLRQLRDAIEELERVSKDFTGKQAYLAKKMLIEMRQDQYIIKAAYRKPIYFLRAHKGSHRVDWSESIHLTEEGEIHYTGRCTVYDPEHVSALLCNYSALKQNSYEDLNSDIRWLMEDLDNIIEEALARFPVYYDLLIYKIDGRTNQEIQTLLEQRHQVLHSLEYISSLWRNKIPKLIAEHAQEQWLNWHYTFVEKGTYKTCSKCGETKLAHNRYFSKNRTARSGFYSICKECRNKKNKEAKK